MIESLVPDRRLYWIIATAVVVRILLLFVVDPAQGPFGGDTADYAAGAYRIWNGQPPSSFRAPLYSAFLSVTLLIGWKFTILAQCALTTAGAIATFYVVRGKAGFVAAMLIAACPFLALYDFKLISETLYVQLGWMGFLVAYVRRWVAGGIVLGLAVLARDTLALLPFATGLALVLRGERRALFIPLVAYATVLPWVAVAGGLSHGRSGLNLWLGTWERNGDWTQAGFSKPAFPNYAFRSPSERETVEQAWLRDDATLMRVAVKRIRTDPTSVGLAWITRYPRLWVGTRSDQIAFVAPRSSAIWTVEKLAFLTLNLSLLAFGVWGMWRPDGYALFLVPICYAAVVYVPFHAEIRFTLATLPALIVLGAQRLCGASLTIVSPALDGCKGRASDGPDVQRSQLT